MIKRNSLNHNNDNNSIRKNHTNNTSTINNNNNNSNNMCNRSLDISNLKTKDSSCETKFHISLTTYTTLPLPQMKTNFPFSYPKNTSP